MNKVTFPLREEKQTCKWTSGCRIFTTYFGTCFFIQGQSLWMARVILVEVQPTGVYGRSERVYGGKKESHVESGHESFALGHISQFCCCSPAAPCTAGCT